MVEKLSCLRIPKLILKKLKIAIWTGVNLPIFQKTTKNT